MKCLIFLALLFGSPAFARVSDEEALNWTCREFNKLGDLGDLRAKIRRDMRRLRRLVGNYDGQSDLRRMEPVLESLKENQDRLNQLIGPKYSAPDYLQTKDWRLGSKRLWLGDGPRPYWRIKAARVVRNYNWTLKREEPLAYAQLEALPYSIDVQLRRPASLAELCQFEQMIMVTVEFDVEHKERSKTLRRNLLTMPWEER